MRTLTSPEHYFNPHLYQRETKVFARQCWQYAGLSHELAKDNDFISVQALGRPVVVQNFKGELRAFENICLHRQSLLHACRAGNGPLQCPYHGWTYDKDGRAIGVPHRNTFPDLQDAAAREKLRLPELKVARCGAFVFFAELEVPATLEEYLGAETVQWLADFSSAIGPSVDRTEWTIAANWKVVVENTLEGYHVDKIHPHSFKKLFITSSEKQHFWPPHTASEFELVEGTTKMWKKLEAQLPAHPISLDGYVHIHLFPFTTIASTFGASFSVQRILPLGATQTKFESEVFFTKLEEANKRQSLLASAYGKSIVDFNRSVFDEDKAICELVQKGLEQATQPGWLSTMESRVAAFEKSYLERIGKEL